MSESPLSAWGRREIFHDSLKFSILDADEQKLLSNFSNIPTESGKTVRSGSSQEELLETAYKVGICSSKRIPLPASAGPAQPPSSLRPAAGPRRQQQFPLECPLPVEGTSGPSIWGWTTSAFVGHSAAGEVNTKPLSGHKQTLKLTVY